MRCRYSYCKNGNVVEKEEAIKVETAYYCKECYKEKEDKKIIASELHTMFPREVWKEINKCLTEWIHKKGFSTDYVLYVLDYIKQTNSNVKKVYGVIYYLNNSKILKAYEQDKLMKKYDKMKNKSFISDDSEVRFTYKPTTGKDWCKIL